MREILFKAKRIDNGEWVMGGSIIQFLDDGVRSFYIPQFKEKCICTHDDVTDDILGFENCRFYKVDTDTICQYTGLTDKNGNMIWENDIVWDSEERELYKIIWCQDSMRYCVENGDGFDYEFDSDYASSLETNGNIFDNPELIGGGK